MSKIRVMAIAPYDGLRELINKISHKYSDQIEVTSVVGDLYQGLQIAKSAEREGYDIIISRGGTSELIMKAVSIPVINIEVSGYDYMRAIKLAENIPGPRAVIGFPHNIESARSVNDLLETDIRMFTVQSQDEIAPLLRRLISEGYRLVIGDVATERRAHEMGMNGMLLTSGEESVDAAFSKAITLCNEIDKYRKRSNMFQRVVEESLHSVAVFSTEKRLLYKNFVFDELGVSNVEFLGYLDNIIYTGRQDIILQKGMKLITMSGRLLNIDEQNKVVAFYIDYDNSGTRENTKGITFYNAQYQSGRLLDLFKENDLYDKKIIETMNSFCKTNLPVFLIGAIGVGKSSIAYAIHRCSEGYQKPFVSVDCRVAYPEGWEKLFYADEGAVPLINEATVCFENIDKMPFNWQEKLSALLENPDVTNRYRFIATASENVGDMVKQEKFNEKLYAFFSQLILNLPGIHQRIKDLKNIVNIFIIESNAKFGKQVIGIEDDALILLERYPWKYNFKELNQVVAQLVLTSSRSYIGVNEVHTVLDAHSGKSSDQIEMIELNGTLDEIETKVMQCVLELEEGNLLKTAKRLGIGRSTLWRKLKKFQQEDVKE
jgi:Response regulator containing CheY-like receiver, AAA-type ATPase, and DNA-binding domains